MNGWLQAAVRSAGIMDWLRGRAAWMEGFAATPHATVWLFVFAFAESSFFPIPPDVLLIALCLTESSSMATAMWFAAVCTVASAAGGAFGYVLGAKAGRPILRRFASPERVEAAEALLQRYDVWAVGAAGFTPIPYKIFTIASGLLRVSFARFLVVSVASRGARFFLVAAICQAAGRPVREILDRHLWWVAFAFFVLLVGGFWAVRAIAGRKQPGPQSGPGGAGGEQTGPQSGPGGAERKRPGE